MPKKTCLLAIFALVCFFSSLQAITQEELQEYAIKNNDSDLIEILMKYGNECSPILYRAMEAHDYFTVFMLIEYGVDINSRLNTSSQTVLEMALERNEIPFLEYCLLNKADPTIITQGNKRVTNKSNNKKELIICNTTAVYSAIILDRLDILILFSQYDVDLNKICYEQWPQNNDSVLPTFEQTPLQVAVAHKKKEIANFLLSIGVEI